MATPNYNKLLFYDTETVGIKPPYIISLGYILCENNKIVKRDIIKCNPKYHISEGASKVNGFTDEMVKDWPTFEEEWPKIAPYFENAILVRHNLPYDIGSIKAEFKRYNLPELHGYYVDTLPIARKYMPKPEVPNHKLGTLCEYFGINLENAHTADADIYATMKLFNRLVRITKGQMDVKEF